MLAANHKEPAPKTPATYLGQQKEQLSGDCYKPHASDHRRLLMVVIITWTVHPQIWFPDLPSSSPFLHLSEHRTSL